MLVMKKLNASVEKIRQLQEQKGTGTPQTLES